MPPTVTQERSVGCRLRRDPAQVSQARRLVRETLADWGLDGYIDHTVLISSELVTNALRHGAGMISIRLYRARCELRVEVHDHGAGRPVRRRAGTADESGRGLAVIDGLISMYNGQRGCTDDRTGPGKTVYVVLPIITNAVGAWSRPPLVRPPGSLLTWQRPDACWPACSGRPGSGPPTGGDATS